MFFFCSQHLSALIDKESLESHFLPVPTTPSPYLQFPASTVTGFIAPGSGLPGKQEGSPGYMITRFKLVSEPPSDLKVDEVSSGGGAPINESLECKHGSGDLWWKAKGVFPSHTWGIDFALPSTAALLQTVPKRSPFIPNSTSVG